MISLFYFLRLALHNLRRGGQRVLAALLCIAFGVAALVALTLIAKSVEHTIRVKPAELVGGDLSLGRLDEEPLRPEHLAQLDALQQSGKLSAYTQIAYNNSSIMFHTARSSEMHAVGIGMGVEPAKYPLAGALTIGQPARAALPDLLQQVGDVVITRDIALEYQLQAGDPIILSDLRFGLPVQGTVRGVAFDTPNHQGDKLYYTIETAQTLANGQPAANTVIATSSQGATAAEALENHGWAVDWVTERRGNLPANAWVMGLRGAGILGLLVGGVGIANTMQVLLRRRQVEIAIWKTLGYTAGHLHLLFLLEAGLLGLTGSLLGAGLGALISGQVLELIRRMSTVLYTGSFSPTPPLLGVLVGTLTTLIFAAWVTVTSGQARPVALLRGERLEVQPVSGCLSVGLGLLLAVPFTLLAGLIMQSFLAGLAVLVVIGVGLFLLGGFFSLLLWICTHLLPLRPFPLVRLAFTRLRRGGFALVCAMIALFVGILSMSLGLAVTQFSERKIGGRTGSFETYNLNILAPAGQEGAVRRALTQAAQAQAAEKTALGYRTALAGLNLPGRGPVEHIAPVLVGRSDPHDYIVDGAEWGSQPDGVYVPQQAGLPAGSQVEVTRRDGTTLRLTVVGSYRLNDRSLSPYPPSGLLMSAEGFKRAASPDSVTFFIQFPLDRLDQAAAALGAALPQATLLNLVDYAGRYMHAYRKLYILPVVLAGLALIAGLLLVSNSVSLAVLDRREEIGILKTIGYSRRQVQALFALEYGMVGLLATGTAVSLIQGLLAVYILADHLPLSVLLLGLPPLAVSAGCGIGLTLLTVWGVTWAPTGLPPLAVLNKPG